MNSVIAYKKLCLHNAHINTQSALVLTIMNNKQLFPEFMQCTYNEYAYVVSGFVQKKKRTTTYVVK